MDNKKDLNLSSDELSEAVDKAAVTEDNFSSAIDKSQDYTDKALDSELEMLAETFRQELKKAQTMSAEELLKNGIVIQQYEDEAGVIPEEELCKCCGEQRRDKKYGENYEYCHACREAMRRYPLSIPGIITLAAMVFVAVVSVFSFVADFNIYNTVRMGDKYLSENKKYSALDSYEGAISAFLDKGVLAEKLHLKNIGILYETMPDGAYSMSDIIGKIETVLGEFKAKIPLYRTYVDMHHDMQVVSGTLNEFYILINDDKYLEYNFKENKEQYEETMTDIGSIIDKQITVTSADKKTSQLVSASEVIVRYCQYMFAYANGYYADSYQYMNKVCELEPSYLWLYAYELGMAELQSGDKEKAQSLATALYESNSELSDAFALQSAIYRMSGKIDKAIEWADAGIASDSTNTELYRIKAMAYAAKGDFEAAKKILDETLASDSYGMLTMTAIVVENELGNKDRVKELKVIMEENDLEISERTKNYLKGKISAQDMFTKGTGDVE